MIRRTPKKPRKVTLRKRAIRRIDNADLERAAGGQLAPQPMAAELNTENCAHYTDTQLSCQADKTLPTGCAVTLHHAGGASNTCNHNQVLRGHV